MIFEYDKNKSRSNLAKHGIDFEEAQQLWNDPYLARTPAHKVGDEERIICVAQYMEKHWTAVILQKIGSVRIISVRRSRKSEVSLYEYHRRRI